MNETELLLVDGRAQVAEALANMKADCPFNLCSAFSRRAGGGEQGSWSACSHVGAGVPGVDELTYQVTVRAEDLDRLRSLCAGVNRAMRSLGLRRSYAGEDGYDSGGTGAYTKTYRFSRRVDKRSMRLID